MPNIYGVSNKMDRAQDNERIKHLSNLSKYTHRNIIVYYADFFTKKNKGYPIDIRDSDLHGFMSTVYGLDKSKGLDLILHTPGGDPAATESIVTYLRSIFGLNIRAIVPHMAMSAGTMLACSCSEIIMGKHSSLGPIDPQFSGIPAIDIVQEFDQAKKEIKQNPKSVGYWSLRLEDYPSGLYSRCVKSIELSETLAKKWLETNMLVDSPELVQQVIDKLNENQESKTHSRHFDKEQCKSIGLKIIDLESDPKLQDYVLSIHHCYMYLFNRSEYIKIIENQKGLMVIT